MSEFDVKVEPPKRGNEDPETIRRIEVIAGWLDGMVGARFWFIAATVLAGLILGTPHILVKYRCYYGPCTRERAYSCDYLGAGGWRRAQKPEPQAGCAPFRLL